MRAPARRPVAQTPKVRSCHARQTAHASYLPGPPRPGRAATVTRTRMIMPRPPGPSAAGPGLGGLRRHPTGLRAGAAPGDHAALWCAGPPGSCGITASGPVAAAGLSLASHEPRGSLPWRRQGALREAASDHAAFWWTGRLSTNCGLGGGPGSGGRCWRRPAVAGAVPAGWRVPAVALARLGGGRVTRSAGRGGRVARVAGQAAAAGAAVRARARMALRKLWVAAHRCSSRLTMVPR